MHVRIDDFESNLVEACDAFEEERLRDQFIAEVSLVDKEIITLRAFMEKTKAELEQVNYDGSAARVRSNAVLIKDDGAANPDRGSKFLFPDELVKKTREDEAATTDGIVNQAEPLWRDFLQRCDHAFHLPRGARVVGKEKLLKLVEDVLRAKHERNLAALETEPTSDFFYNFIHDTYGVPHAAMLVIHGILTALIQFREEHPILAMFSAILTGSLDEAAWEYSMHWRELLKQFPVGSMHELQHYVLQLYPGFSDQETSEFINEFHTTSVICTSDSLIAHLTDKLLQRSEMRLRKWMRVLRWRDAQHSGGLRKLEFNGLVQEFFGSASEELVAFYCSNLTSKHGNSRVPLEGWAFVCCCLEVFQKSPRSMDF
ncbi:hypothetical protein BSKO_08377 [Bryopsis sp. KO-2023]|nr:hypothetical protein BSKO_08377 [Bryopsis sp. KO-2023]